MERLGASQLLQPADYATMCRRVVDVAGCAAGQLKVILNGRDVSQESFLGYCQLYRHTTFPLCYARVNPRWEVAIGVSESNGASFDHISFVNGMATTRGGTHVNAVVQQVAKAVCDRLARLHPELKDTITPGLVRRHLFIGCNALIENPTFDSQMKEALTCGPTTWGSECNLTKKYLSQLVLPLEDGGPGIIEEVIAIGRGRQQATLFREIGGAKAKRRQLLSIPKLEDAHEAGGNNSCDCTLILTEGDSAKALAVAGLEVIGRENFGVFPLRGKFLNVRDASIDQLTNNAEVKALCSILGLDFDKEYDTMEERSQLRYGHIMLMTDQDMDGSHIKGLVMNFFRHFWPKILKPAVDLPLQKPFLSSFVTPLLKATPKKSKSEVLSFFSMAEYNEWRSSLESLDDLKNWNLKYYKGLGTSTPAEAKEYFTKFKQHVRPFHWNSTVDGELLDMVFDKNRAADRRDWILDEYDEQAIIVPDADHDNAVSFEDFVNKEMIHFSNADNIRSLPHVMDGLKPSQRKVLYACFKRKLKSEVKVAQLTGYCAEHTAYHHGEASLQSTIISMAQDFVGSNNINLLIPSGQFGTRLTGGKDAASPRYIFTYLAPIARLLFPEADDILLDHREDDGLMIEPFFYCPIIPLLLVNGSQGIGTGWSSFIPPHSPTDVVAYIRAKIDKSVELPRIRPWVRGFHGDIVPREDGSGFSTLGKIERKSSKSVLISELPVGRWTSDYKETLIKMREKNEIESFLENHTTTKVSFTVSSKSVQLDRFEKSGLHKFFKLVSSLPVTNMNAFDVNNRIVKFSSAEAIADSYFPVRLSLYSDRKSVLESEMNYTTTMMRNKARFIQAVADGDVDLVRQQHTKQDTLGRLMELGFDDSNTLKAVRSDNAVQSRVRDGAIAVDDEPEKSSKDEEGDFDYLLNMPLSSLTVERIQELHRDAERNESQLEVLKKTSPEDLWRSDLDQLEAHF
jgi:DNA topoisomerase-2